MKLRIKGNSLRIRLTKTEVAKLADIGWLQEQTEFGNGKLIYALQTAGAGNELSATFDTNKITILVPQKLIIGWPENNVVGFSASMPITATKSLYLLLEKDFVCLDETAEDQSDHYDNPNKTC